MPNSETLNAENAHDETTFLSSSIQNWRIAMLKFDSAMLVPKREPNLTLRKLK